VVSASARREAVHYAHARGVSKRRAGALLNIGGSSLRYKTRSKEQESAVIAKLRALSAANPRFGYRFVAAILRRDGMVINNKRVYRLWRKAGLARRRKPAFKRRHGGQHRWMSAIAPNGIWAYDFVFDACANGQKLKCLTVVDEFTRESLAIDVGARLRSANVINVLERLIALHGPPTHLRSDNGPEFVAKAVQDWLSEKGIKTAYIQPGKPWQNGVAESFNSKFRDECLNMEWFSSRREAIVFIEAWRNRYNNYRPHSAIGYRTPAEQRARTMSVAKTSSTQVENAAA
jgi:putative transposase